MTLNFTTMAILQCGAHSKLARERASDLDARYKLLPSGISKGSPGASEMQTSSASLTFPQPSTGNHFTPVTFKDTTNVEVAVSIKDVKLNKSKTCKRQEKQASKAAKEKKGKASTQ